MNVDQISVQELKHALAGGEPVCLVDVREPWEVEIARIPGALHIPMGEIAQRLQELDPQANTVVMCKAGGRSLRVAAFLKSRGFAHVANLTGGIDAWARDIDPTLQSY